jgi:hypothetical protein
MQLSGLEVGMRKRSVMLASCGAALALFTLGAHAITCDIVVDRNGTVVYQDVIPPVDMSDRGAAARDRMRQRGEQLMIIDVDQCPQLVFSTISGAASVDEIVATMRPYVGANGGMGMSARPGASGNVSAASPAPAPTRTSASGRPY